MLQQYIKQLESHAVIARGTKNVAERIQRTSPFPVSDHLAFVAALALTAETTIGLSTLNNLRKLNEGVDDTLEQITANYILGIAAVAHNEGHSFERVRELLAVAEQAMIADLEEFDRVHKAEPASPVVN